MLQRLSLPPSTSQFPPASIVLGNSKKSDSEKMAIKPLKVREVTVTESEAEIRILIPIAGVDIRNVHVLAGSRHILIEIRIKKVIPHDANAPIVQEISEQRISREFKFRSEIQRGATTVQVVGDDLHIIARKAPQDAQHSWSELLHFDPRPSEQALR